MTRLDFMQPPLWRERGHVDAQDAQPEHINIDSTLPRPHLGYSPISSYKPDAMLLFTAICLPAPPPQALAGEALRGLGFLAASSMADNPQFELWSRLAARHVLSLTDSDGGQSRPVAAIHP